MSDVSWMQRYTARLFPELATIGWTHCWNGQLAVTTDHYPHLHTPAENVMICLGYNGRGVAMSTAMGGAIARWAGGAASGELNMPVTTLKEIPFHGLWKLGASARITYGRVRDYLGI